jgi:hypothetical protein
MRAVLLIPFVCFHSLIRRDALQAGAKIRSMVMFRWLAVAIVLLSASAARAENRPTRLTLVAQCDAPEHLPAGTGTLRLDCRVGGQTLAVELAFGERRPRYWETMNPFVAAVTAPAMLADPFAEIAPRYVDPFEHGQYRLTRAERELADPFRVDEHADPDAAATAR